MKNVILRFSVASIIILQSCVTYHYTPLTLNKASNQGKGKIITKNGEVLVFSNIEKKDSSYYAVDAREKRPNNVGESQLIDRSVPIDTPTVTAVFLKDKKTSRRQTTKLVVSGILLAPAVGVVIFVAVFAIAGNGW